MQSTTPLEPTPGTVNYQTPVIESFTGQDVLLPCVYRGDPLPETLSVYWRDKGDNIVLDIRRQHPYEESQSQEFRGRVESVPDLYKKGDFSIVLKKVQLMDSGTYRCYIPQVDFQQTVLLIVADTQSLMMQLSPSVSKPSPMKILIISDELDLSGCSQTPGNTTVDMSSIVFVTCQQVLCPCSELIFLDLSNLPRQW
ncbi:hypothetical protein Q5P01_008230 [Channa striata]|uniref:Ig-like domain-containing protein n=1 Tax=Channa striata TaxID=64152 RepID=A0AA88N521_CHASR|nr:hypothetical protein Q5P01_008230 [Channa striata]